MTDSQSDTFSLGHFPWSTAQLTSLSFGTLPTNTCERKLLKECGPQSIKCSELFGAKDVVLQGERRYDKHWRARDLGIAHLEGHQTKRLVGKVCQTFRMTEIFVWEAKSRYDEEGM